MDESRIPVIVGVGQINDRPDSDANALNSLGLMKAALQAADREAGGGWLAKLDSLAVVAQLSFPELGDVSRPLADALGAAPRLCKQTPYPSGDSPVLLLNEAANRIAAGEIEVGAVAGGEALRTAARRIKTRADAPNAVREAAARGARPLRQRYGIVAPTDIYPLYENACRAAWGQSLAEGQHESAQIWSLFSQVAAANPDAWLRRALTPKDILTPSADNRPIAFPYTKLMVANASVNQGAAFIVASLAKAKAIGVRADQLVFVGAGAAAREPGDILARDRFDRSSSMGAALRNALAFNNLSSSDLDWVELYSCFPCIPKLARRIIDWPAERAATVFGGLTFGGGPVGNYMSHAVAAMVQKLRTGGRFGLLFANGGFATTNHAIVLSRDVPAVGPRDFNVQLEADAARGAAPALIEDYTGPGSIETYTVFYDRAGAPSRGVVIARTPDGARFICRVPGDDLETISFLTSGKHEPVGAHGEASPDSEGVSLWRCGNKCERK
ncbi:MAG: acetyl-CoA acetyltransferase [Proteobacteria bacterium]|nr:acetyl-CoA acetyltransferase [Pseudomonadota bacterium]